MRNQKIKSAVKTKVLKDRYMLCPECGNFAHISLGQVYCIVCGAKMIDRCPRCEELIIYPTAKFCPVCGEKLVKKEI
ncbi:zinc ribbon domain-containing protein [Candidatus Chrysopegis kryptomonas]|jgi:ribosomal protein S27E|uniref:Double zinc ribbon n=1 Tax=Candidatus Chryseopegocella kryptomonas TaxID=1633643 RepID=A0A0P1MLZ6_9BACT|nr:zinc ribbon domain-containing protein [Candidatus Chrysopegis kryptomonas]CUS96430.1 Double zinc ribbon [Candidatus Chrysopegis kryptomonas]